MPRHCGSPGPQKKKKSEHGREKGGFVYSLATSRPRSVGSKKKRGKRENCRCIISVRKRGEERHLASSGRIREKKGDGCIFA